MEGENVRYEDSVDDGTWGCPYNGGLLCTNPTTCLCRQVSKGVPDGLEQQMRNVGLVLWQMMIPTQCFCISFFWVGNINQYLVYCSRFSHYTSHLCIFTNVLCKNHCSEDTRKAANEIIKKKRLSGDKTCVIRLTGEAARPQNEWSENDMLAMAFPVEFPFGLSSFRTRRHVPTEDIT